MIHGACGIDPRRRIGQQLINSIDAHRKGARALIKLEGRNDRVRRLFGGHRALIAIAERLAQRLAIGSQPHVVHAPTVHADRGNAFRRRLRRLAQPLFKPGKNRIERPVERIAAMHRPIRNAMDDFDLRFAAHPSEAGKRGSFQRLNQWQREQVLA